MCQKCYKTSATIYFGVDPRLLTALSCIFRPSNSSNCSHAVICLLFLRAGHDTPRRPSDSSGRLSLTSQLRLPDCQVSSVPPCSPYPRTLVPSYPQSSCQWVFLLPSHCVTSEVIRTSLLFNNATIEAYGHSNCKGQTHCPGRDSARAANRRTKVPAPGCEWHLRPDGGTILYF